MLVLSVICSLNNIIDINVKTKVPIAKPINLEGQSCPSNQLTKFFTELMKRNEIGIPNKIITHSLSFIHGYLNLPWSWKKVKI